MLVIKKYIVTQRNPAWAILLTLLVGALLWLALASLVRGLQKVASAEPVAGNSSTSRGPIISFSPAPALAQKSDAAKHEDKLETKPTPGKNAKGDKGENAGAFSPAEESAVQEFLAANHPELGRVLGSLKKKHAREYARAINDLSHTQSKLEQFRRHDEAKYQRELEAWQLRSRIQLLVARLKMNPSDEALRTELKQDVALQIEQQREQLQSERERLQQRLEKIDAQIERLSGEPNALVEQRMKQWLTSIDNNRGANAPKKKSNPTDSTKAKNSENNSKVKLER